MKHFLKILAKAIFITTLIVAGLCVIINIVHGIVNLCGAPWTTLIFSVLIVGIVVGWLYTAEKEEQ